MSRLRTLVVLLLSAGCLLTPASAPASVYVPPETIAAQPTAAWAISPADRARVEHHDGLGFTYTDLLAAVSARQIVSANFQTSQDPSQDTVSVKLKGGRTYTLGYPDSSEQQLTSSLAAYGAAVSFNGSGYEGSSASGSISMFVLLPIALAVLIPLAAVIVLVHRKERRRRREGSLAGVNGSHAKMDDAQAKEMPDTTFADVAGCDEAVEEVSEFLDFLRAPGRFNLLGAKMPSGVLLHGPPGTGKTLLAKALAGEAGVPFFATSGSEFVEMYVGVGASRIRSLFAKARKCKEAVIFIDELDAVGGKRNSGAHGNREADQTLNQLLVEMDGFNGRQRIVVIAATNRLDTLDPALLRPGRFSRHIQVPNPDEPGRRAILAVHAAGKPLAADVDLDRLARITAGSSGAHLAEMLNEGAIWGARQEHDEITHADLWEGLCRVLAGPRKATSPLAEGELEVVAYHEAGHVLAGELCETQDETQHATVAPRGRALGFALKGATDRGLQNEQHLHESLMTVLAGRAAEYVVFSTVSSGAANDLQQANLLSRQAIEEWGLSPRVGQLSVQGGALSEATRGVVDEEIARLVGDAYRDAVSLIERHRKQLELLAKALLHSGEIARPEIELALIDAKPSGYKPTLNHHPLRIAA